MRGAVLTELNQPLEVWDGIEIPEPARGQVQVKLAFSGVCHSQLMEARGSRGNDPYVPHLLGHEGTGVVQKIGDGVTKVRVGDRVVMTWIKGRGLEAGGVKYTHQGRTVNAGGVTTFNDHALVSENRLVALPEGVSMDVGVLFGCALLTGAGIVLNTLKPEAGSTIAVFGLGGVGLSALMAASFSKPKLLIAIDVEDDKLELSRHFGATHTVNATKQSAADMIRELTGGTGVDFSMEAAGLARTIETAFSSVRKNGGLCVFASHPKSGEKIQIDPYELICGKRIEGTWGGACDPDRDIPLLARLIREHGAPIEKLVNKRYSLNQINEALDDLENRRVARPLIEISTAAL